MRDFLAVIIFLFIMRSRNFTRVKKKCDLPSAAFMFFFLQYLVTFFLKLKDFLFIL